MAVAFAVGSNMDKLGTLPLVMERADEPIGQMLAAGEQSFKSDRPSDWSVIKKQGNLLTRRQPLFVGLGRIDARAADVVPDASADGSDAVRLVRGKNSETNS